MQTDPDPDAESELELAEPEASRRWKRQSQCVAYGMVVNGITTDPLWTTARAEEIGEGEEDKSGEEEMGALVCLGKFMARGKVKKKVNDDHWLCSNRTQLTLITACYNKSLPTTSY
jgi:hypothetical protein